MHRTPALFHSQTRISSPGILAPVLEIVETSLWNSGRLCDVKETLRAVNEALMSIVNFSAAMTKSACLPPTPKDSDTIVIGGLDWCRPVRRSIRIPKDFRRKLSNITGGAKGRCYSHKISLSERSVLLVFHSLSRGMVFKENFEVPGALLSRANINFRALSEIPSRRPCTSLGLSRAISDTMVNANQLCFFLNDFVKWFDIIKHLPS
jgi:hypothetical protein